MSFFEKSFVFQLALFRRRKVLHNKVTTIQNIIYGIKMGLTVFSCFTRLRKKIMFFESMYVCEYIFLTRPRA